MVASDKMTDSGCGRTWRGAEKVESVLWVSGSATLSARAFDPPLIKTCADTGCVEIIAAMIPKTTPLFCNSNPKYNRDFFKT